MLLLMVMCLSAELSTREHHQEQQHQIISNTVATTSFEIRLGVISAHSTVTLSNSYKATKAAPKSSKIRLGNSRMKTPGRQTPVGRPKMKRGGGGLRLSFLLTRAHIITKKGSYLVRSHSHSKPNTVLATTNKSQERRLPKPPRLSWTHPLNAHSHHGTKWGASTTEE